MKVVTFEVRALKSALNDVGNAFASERAAGAARISFDSPELLWRVLTEKRWEILKAMMGAGALSILEIAGRVKRDVKAVHCDVNALLEAGIIMEMSAGRVCFQYDAIHVDYVLEATTRASSEA